MSLPRKHPLAEAVALLALVAAVIPDAHAGDIAIDLGNLGSSGFRIDGIDADDGSGRSVSGAGDVNGDGLADLIVGADDADPGGDSGAGETHVVFGKANNTTVDLANLGNGGFRIDGIDAGDGSGRCVSGAGDVNGDGLADLIIGASGANPGGDNYAGETYVVFGKTNSATVDLANLGNGGFRIDGANVGDHSGYSVSSAGDVNGDGFADLIVGVPDADPLGDFGGSFSAGEAFVVFGKANSATVDLANLGSGGFRIDGIDPLDHSGRSVSGAGDVNGDGLTDIVIGAVHADPSGRNGAGETYVVFGKTDNTLVQLSALGNGGFRVDGIDASDGSGHSVSGAGDINGDGLADLIVGASGAAPGGDSYAGETYVVFGKANNTTVDLANLGNGGFRIDGIDSGDFSGGSVSGAGDFNGDGFADLVVGAKNAGNASAGESYLIFGKPNGTTVDLGHLGNDGFRIDGAHATDRSGHSVSGAGDVNGDGLADLVIGAPYADPNGDTDAGESYVVFSPDQAAVSAAYRVRSRNGNPPQTAVGVSGDGSNASHPDARAWIDFASGAAAVGPASTTIVTRIRNAGSFSGAAANVHWQIQTNRVNFLSAEVMFRYLDSELTSSEQQLQLVYSPTGSAPFTPLNSVLNTQNNTISAVVAQTGFFYLRSASVFGNGFE